LIDGNIDRVATQSGIAGEPHDANQEDRDRDRLRRLLDVVRNEFHRETGDVARHRDDGRRDADDVLLKSLRAIVSPSWAPLHGTGAPFADVSW
jgi:hypothetical protein